MKKRTRAQAHLKRHLAQAGVTYDDVARLSGVTWRMVKFVIDGDRTSARVMNAIERLAGPIAQASR